jgi:hypothetical protein
LFSHFEEAYMISTVTTSTVTTVTTAALAASLALLAIVALLVLLIQKEVISVSDNQRMQTWSKVLNIAILPLLLGSIFIVVVKVAELLR